MIDEDVVRENSAAVHRHDAWRAIRLVVILGIVAALVLVGFDNRRDVRLGYVIGDANAPVWIVVIGAAVAGMVIGGLMRRRRET